VAVIIARHVNALLKVAKVMVDGKKLAVRADGFIEKSGVPREVIIKRLIDDVLIGLALIAKESKSFHTTTGLLEKIPVCHDVVLN
jgi:hypothetical protein